MTTASSITKENNTKDSVWYEPIENPKAGGRCYARVPIQFLLDRRITSNTSKLMFVALCQYANNKTGLVGAFDATTRQYNTPSVRTLARLVGVSYSNASTAMQQLIDTQWITVKRRQNQSSIIHVRIPFEIDVYDENRGKFHYQEDLLSNEDYAIKQSEIKARNKIAAANRLAKRAEAKAIKKKTADSFDTRVYDDVSDEPFENSGALAKLAAKRAEIVFPDIALAIETAPIVASRAIKPMPQTGTLSEIIFDIARYTVTADRSFGDYAAGIHRLSYDLSVEELIEEFPNFESSIKEAIAQFIK